eukprot:EC819034.1.p1 GENE.EC819034.1~~EC819034.1.p1  ORF type:complete len:64 (+),score=26.96 EC819034.1:109-300(+)
MFYKNKKMILKIDVPKRWKDAKLYFAVCICGSDAIIQLKKKAFHPETILEKENFMNDDNSDEE